MNKEKYMDNLTRIASFSVDHDLITEGIYVSRIDGDVTTYDLRTRVPNNAECDYMSNLTMHSLEHLFATYVRNSEIGTRVIYFGPMGCQTGFYLLVRDAENSETLRVVKATLERIIAHEGSVPGAERKECGNYKNLDLGAAKAEAERYLAALNSREWNFKYPEA